MAVAWFALLYDAVKAEKMDPPPASRADGVAAVALYQPLEPRTFGSFEEAAVEAAMPRLYGGIHSAFGNES